MKVFYQLSLNMNRVIQFRHRLVLEDNCPFHPSNKGDLDGQIVLAFSKLNCLVPAHTICSNFPHYSGERPRTHPQFYRFERVLKERN